MCLCVKCNSGQHVIGGRKRAFMGNYGQICIKPTRQQTRLACPIMKVKPYLNRVTLSVFSQVVILCKERKIGKLLATAIETTSETSVNFASVFKESYHHANSSTNGTLRRYHHGQQDLKIQQHIVLTKHKKI